MTALAALLAGLFAVASPRVLVDEDIYRALEAGAVTYLLKEALSDELVTVIREVHAGGRPISPDVAALLAAADTA